MSNTKTAAQAMRYELTGDTKVKDTDKVAIKFADTLSSSRLIWILVKRHKVGLLAIGNIVLVLNWLMPAWPTIVRSLFN